MSARLTELNSLLNIKSDEVYYYTQTKTFLEKIIQPATPNKLFIYFSHYKNLEDSQEFIMGIDIIKEFGFDSAYDKQIDYYKDKVAPFQLSMTLAKDAYPMWKIYGKNEPSANLSASNGPGIMLSFNKEKLLTDLKKDSQNANILPCLYKGKPGFRKVPSLLKEGLIHNYDINNLGFFNNFFIEYPSIVKSKQYSYEKEVRAIGILTSSRAQKHNPDCHKEAIKGEKVFRPMEIDISTLTEIMIGPCSENTYVEIKNRMKTILQTIGCKISEEHITHSQIPVRE